MGTQQKLGLLQKLPEVSAGLLEVLTCIFAVHLQADEVQDVNTWGLRQAHHQASKLAVHFVCGSPFVFTGATQ